MNITLGSDIVSIQMVYFLKQLYTRAQLSQRKPTVAFCPCYWQTDEIHIVCDLLKTYSGYICGTRQDTLWVTIKH